MTYFKVGDTVKAKKFGQLEHAFTGTVEKVYDNSLMMSIADFDPADKTTVNELNMRAVVRKSTTKILKAVPRTDEDREEAAKEEKEAQEKAAKANKTSRKRKSTKAKSSATKSTKTTKKSKKDTDK